jgi:protein involved in polysaccharide export with SLBB domain
MSNRILGRIVGWWIFCAAPLAAQISTFPPPPPLAPSAPENSAPAALPATNDAYPVPSPAVPSSTPGTGEPTTAGSAESIPVTAATLNSMEALDDKVTLNPGDRISFRVIEDRDEAVSRVVTDTGEVDFPYVGRIKVQGKTCREVAQQLKKLLEVDYYKRATVIVGLDVIASHTTEVVHDLAWVVGQVRNVGPQELSKVQPITVSQVILRAGGFGDFADQRRVRVIHRSGPTAEDAGPPTAADIASIGQTSEGSEIVDVKAVFDGVSSVDPVVRPNDLIIVPKRLVNF